MNFITYAPLKEQLRERTLSDRQALPYLIASTTISAFLLSIPLHENYNLLDGLSVVVSLTLAIAGILFAYNKNGKENGYDLIQKFMVIGWITGVRFILIGIPISVVVGVVAHYLGFSFKETNPVGYTYYILFEALLYYRIGKHIEDTRGTIQAG